jgi:hypothetical protein
VSKPCNCPETAKPEGAPDDSIRSAAALWISSGRVLGYSDGVAECCRYLVEMGAGAVDATWPTLDPAKKAQVVSLLANIAAHLAKGQAERAAESDQLKRLAVAMVDRLEQQDKRGFRDRLRAALVAFRG